MNKVPSASDFLKGFQTAHALIQSRRKLLDAHVSAPKRDNRHVATMSELAALVGYKNFNAANLHYGTLAKIVGSAMGLAEPEGGCWVSIFVRFVHPQDTESGHWELHLKQEVAEAWAKFCSGKSN